MKKKSRKSMFPNTILLTLTILSLTFIISINTNNRIFKKEPLLSIPKSINLQESASFYSYLDDDVIKKQ